MVMVMKKEEEEEEKEKKEEKKNNKQKKRRRRRRRRRRLMLLCWKLIYIGKIYHSGRRLVPLNHQYAAGGPNQKRNCRISLHPLWFIAHVP